MATKRLPKQILPKLVVMVRMKLPHTALEQHPLELGVNHQDPTTPATAQWTEF